MNKLILFLSLVISGCGTMPLEVSTITNDDLKIFQSSKYFNGDLKHSLRNFADAYSPLFDQLSFGCKSSEVTLHGPKVEQQNFQYVYHRSFSVDFAEILLDCKLKDSSSKVLDSFKVHFDKEGYSKEFSFKSGKGDFSFAILDDLKLCRLYFDLEFSQKGKKYIYQSSKVFFHGEEFKVQLSEDVFLVIDFKSDQLDKFRQNFTPYKGMNSSSKVYTSAMKEILEEGIFNEEIRNEHDYFAAMGVSFSREQLIINSEHRLMFVIASKRKCTQFNEIMAPCTVPDYGSIFDVKVDLEGEPFEFQVSGAYSYVSIIDKGKIFGNVSSSVING